MRNHPRFYFWLLTALTILSLLFVLPNSLPVHIKLPFLSINKTLYPLNPNFWFGNTPIKKEISFREGLDLAGGTSVTLEADMSHIKADQRDNALASAKEVISRRVNLYGVSEPLVQTSKVNNSYRLLVDLPGVNVDQAVQLVGKTAQLSFWEDAGGTPSAELATSSALPLGLTQILHNPKETNLTGKDLQDSTVTFDQQTGQPQVQVTFTADGTTKFADITKRNVNKPVVIVLDNQIVSYPTVQQPILNGDAVINGSFTSDQANQLSVQLRAGALPVPMKILEQSSIGATLGTSYLQKSLFAGLIGFIIIVLFMVVLYGRLGILASCALVLYTLLVLVIFKLIPVTLTLAGIAGFILSIGMAVDANILIFERMKEESI